MSRNVIAAAASALLVVLLGASLGASPAGAQTSGVKTKRSALTDTAKATVAQEVLGAVRPMFAATAKMTPDVSRFFWDTPDFAFLTPDGNIYNYADCIKLYGEFVSQLSGQRYVIRTEKVIVLGPDQALYFWQGADDLVLKDGTVQKQDPYCGTYLYRKVNGEWRIAYGEESGPPPTAAKPETAPPKK